MGILALVLYVLGFILNWAFIEEGFPGEFAETTRIFLSIIWPLCAVLYVGVVLYEKVFEK